MQPCQYHPDNTLVVCEKPASRQVYFPHDGGGYYIYICDDCLPQAMVYWKDNGFDVEF